MFGSTQTKNSEIEILKKTKKELKIAKPWLHAVANNARRVSNTNFDIVSKLIQNLFIKVWKEDKSRQTTKEAELCLGSENEFENLVNKSCCVVFLLFSPLKKR